MGKYSNKNGTDNNSQPSKKVRSIDELLAAKKASNQRGVDTAATSTTKATNKIRKKAGKAKRSGLQNDLMKQARLAQAQGEEDGIKQFLNEDIPAVLSALEGEIKEEYKAKLEANEQKMLLSALKGELSGQEEAIDAEWSVYEIDDDEDDDDFGVWGGIPALSGSSTTKVLPSSVKKEEDPFSID